MKRLWRVKWIDRAGFENTRHYQSKSAALHRVNVLCDGTPEDPGTYTHVAGDTGGRDAVPPARWVRVDRSDPILFPADYADEVAAIQRSLQPVTGTL